MILNAQQYDRLPGTARQIVEEILTPEYVAAAEAALCRSCTDPAPGAAAEEDEEEATLCSARKVT